MEWGRAKKFVIVLLLSPYVADALADFTPVDDFIEELRFKSIPTRWHYAKVMFWLIDARKQGKFRKKWANVVRKERTEQETPPEFYPH